MASNVGGFLRRKKSHGTGYVGGRAHAAERNLLGGGLLKLVAQHFRHGGFDETGGGGVARKISRCPTSRRGHRQATPPRLLCGIICLAPLPPLSRKACDVLFLFPSPVPPP